MYKTISLLSFFILNIGFTKGQSFTNPILAGFYPDPSICKVNSDYYLVNSSFAYYPGLPIFHSKDLVNWKQIGHVLDRPEQLNLDSAGLSRGLYAPDITYHKGVYYVICTLVDKLGNFVVTATNPKGPWSNPVALPEINGIDPALFFDDNDSAYIVYNSIPPNNISVHNGHRTIRINNFEANTLKVTSNNRVIINGGTDMAKKPVWIEGPHIFKKDGWYYLICAEGGTAENHSEVVFRTKSLYEPFIPYEKNPILTQRHLPNERKNPITSTGHADFVEDDSGKWWAVFLGCRPYKDNFYNTGRETFMAPIEWKNGWPYFALESDVVKTSYSIDAKKNKNAPPFNGNFLYRDKFNKSKLNDRYSFLRTVKTKWHTIEKGKLQINLQPESVEGKLNPSFVGFRQPHLKGYAATSISFNPSNQKEQAGVTVFQNAKHYYYLCKSISNGIPVVQLLKSSGTKLPNDNPTVIASQNIEGKKKLYLKIEANGEYYSFYYATQKGNWNLLHQKADATFLSTKEAGGFIGCMYAMYATSNGSSTNSVATYDWFECQSNDTNY